MMKNIFLLYIAVGICSTLSAQSLSSKVVASGGGFRTGTAGSLSYTIGEAAVSTFKTTNSIVTQGFQQGTGAGSGSSVVSLVSGNVSVQLFPNPASSFVEFSITAPANAKVGIAIYNILGDKICDVADINSTGFNYRAVQSVSDLAIGVYFAKVSITDQSGVSIQTISKSFIVHH